MKNLKTILGAIALTALAAASAQGQITGSKHDFSGQSWSGGEICKPCHTPHFAAAGVPRLWNHTLTTATYTLNGGGTATAAVDFDIVSRMCMSCHDGTVALDSFGGSTGSTNIAVSAKLGTDLSDDHPVGSEAEYPPSPQPSWWSGSFRAANASHAVVNGASSVSLKSWVDTGGVTQYVVGCTTCHNAHNKGNLGSGKMLAVTNAGSSLCLTCHIK